MSSRDILLTCIWTVDDFVVVDNKTVSSPNEAILKISESESKITVQIPKGLSLINKKIIERRVQSIAKSGFAVPNSSLRIGGGFEIAVTKYEEIPSVLLQEGHKYSYDEFSPTREVTKVVKKTPTVSEEEYIPSFLKHESRESDHPKTIVRDEEKPPLEIIRESEETTVSDLQKQELELPPHGISEILAGRFIIALSEYGDVFFSRNDLSYSVDFSQGKLEFNIVDEKVVILQTERISKDNRMIHAAIETAMKDL
jgi:hypothetical protein